MLVLTRKVGEEIVIGEDVRVTVVAIMGNKVRIGITAPSVVHVFRSEIVGRAAKPNESEVALIHSRQGARHSSCQATLPDQSLPSLRGGRDVRRKPR